jgi:hypothetical protein
MHRTADALVAVALGILGGLPVLAYPFLLLTGVMSFDTGSQGLLHYVVVLGMLAYPAVYFPSLVAAWRAFSAGEHSRGRNLSALPIIYAVVWYLVLVASLMLKQVHG